MQMLNFRFNTLIFKTTMTIADCSEVASKTCGFWDSSPPISSAEVIPTVSWLSLSFIPNLLDRFHGWGIFCWGLILCLSLIFLVLFVVIFKNVVVVLTVKCCLYILHRRSREVGVNFMKDCFQLQLVLCRATWFKSLQAFCIKPPNHH